MAGIEHLHEKRIRLHNVELAFDSFGRPNDPPVLLIAGLGNQLISWREDFCRQLAANGFFVIRFDNRDAGLSTRFNRADTPSMSAIACAYLFGSRLISPYTLDDMAYDALALLDHLGIMRAHVVGGSLGGMIAQTLAINHPSRIRSLTLMLTTYSGSRWPPPRPKSLILFRRPAEGLEAHLERHLLIASALKGPRFELDPAALREHAKRLYERSPEPPGTRRQLAAIAASRIAPSALARLEIPTLVVHGSDDPLLPATHGRRLARIMPDAKLLLVEGLGHEFPPGVWPQVVPAIADLIRQA
ncbi:MAG: alpha/beta hydrolase [Anaerolineales bacterium]